jgi:hypothetical protein
VTLPRSGIFTERRRNLQELGTPEVVVGTLHYSVLFDRWEGEQVYADGRLLTLWMSGTTFARHVAAHIKDVYGDETKEVTPAQLAACREHCMRFAFWHAASGDPEVHMRRLRIGWQENHAEKGGETRC